MELPDPHGPIEKLDTPLKVWASYNGGGKARDSAETFGVAHGARLEFGGLPRSVFDVAEKFKVDAANIDPGGEVAVISWVVYVYEVAGGAVTLKDSSKQNFIGTGTGAQNECSEAALWSGHKYNDGDKAKMGVNQRFTKQNAFYCIYANEGPCSMCCKNLAEIAKDLKSFIIIFMDIDYFKVTANQKTPGMTKDFFYIISPNHPNTVFVHYPDGREDGMTGLDARYQKQADIEQARRQNLRGQGKVKLKCTIVNREQLFDRNDVQGLIDDMDDGGVSPADCPICGDAGKGGWHWIEIDLLGG